MSSTQLLQCDCTPRCFHKIYVEIDFLLLRVSDIEVTKPILLRLRLQLTSSSMIPPTPFQPKNMQIQAVSRISKWKNFTGIFTKNFAKIFPTERSHDVSFFRFPEDFTYSRRTVPDADLTPTSSHLSMLSISLNRPNMTRPSKLHVLVNSISSSRDRNPKSSVCLCGYFYGLCVAQMSAGNDVVTSKVSSRVENVCIFGTTHKFISCRSVGLPCSSNSKHTCSRSS